MTSEVLIVSFPDDSHALTVADLIARHHNLEPYILTISDFPLAAHARFQNYGPVRRAYRDEFHAETDLDAVRSVWWRRPSKCEPPSIFTGLDRGTFVQAECDHFIEGLLWSNSTCLWVNDPMCNLLASRKIVQLTYATDAGLLVPKTLMTNDPKDVLAFLEDNKDGTVVFKRIGTSPGPASKTTFLTADTSLEAIVTCPVTFQEYIYAHGDIRVVWVDGESWAIFIDSQSGQSPEDSRFDLTVMHRPYRLPTDVRDALDRLMLRLGLKFGAIDLRIGRDGQVYFLEVNPAGQFLYLEEITELPLTQAMASLLARGR